jgi:hypothetical protein
VAGSGSSAIQRIAASRRSGRSVDAAGVMRG